MSAAGLTLEVTQTAHQGRALVRMPMDRMSELGLRPGDCVALHVGRTTHARVTPSASGNSGIEASVEITQNMRGDFGSPAQARPADLRDLRSALIRVNGNVDVRPHDLAEALFDLPLTEGDTLSISLPLGREAEVEVITLDPTPAGLFGSETLLTLAAAPPPSADYSDIGGMEREISRVHEMVAVPLLRPDLFERLGVPAPRGVLFTGPPGSGKTLLARSIAARTSAAFFQINGPEIVSKHYGESEAALRAVFEAAAKDSPAIIFIDEIDAIAPRRDVLSGEKQVERRVVAQLLTLMDGLSERGRIIVMAATNLPDSLDPALRRPGRFDREIGFGPPDVAQREAILAVHLRNAPLAPDVTLAEIAAETQGYVGADLAAVAREGSLAALDRAVTQAGGEGRVDPADLFITHADLVRGVDATNPSVLRDTTLESPRLTFDDIGGMEDVKAALTEAVLWPLQHRSACAALGLSPAAGVLLTGPPGSGKTMLARALAAKSGMNFIPVRPARILSQFLGDAERAIAEVFSKARQAAPCLVFFDELDTLAPRRGRGDAAQDRLVAQMLTELDGMAPNADVVVLAATNRAAAIDPALTRSGRFDLIIRIPLPDPDTRKAILDVHCRHLPLDPELDLDRWGHRAEGASGADLAALVAAAARQALRRSLAESADAPVIRPVDFEQAFEDMVRARDARHEDFIDEGTQA
ncbi:AAA family ATPase [uncultured Sulfitobacter sp.]|uniref:AAA family ATPase n=1 Tax=uncultured Sulfitobacter sp. TaxID=191468 RepID=UPI00260958FA|nr:AAA family ATPase [uncultured Sulfitobacter sp.]